MKLRLLSDLHTEFMHDQGRSFVESLNPEGVDVLILAGDVGTISTLNFVLRLFAEQFSSAQILFVAGNHEFYTSTKDDVTAAIYRVTKDIKNLHWLNNDIFELNGVRFLGSTLWFAESKAPKNMMNDFRAIRDFESWVYAENAKAVEFFERELRKGDIAITHYLPSYQCVDPVYAGSPLNAFFVHDVEDIIKEHKPKLWLFGHTHSSVDVTIEETRCISNPFGYCRIEENARFDENLTIEV